MWDRHRQTDRQTNQKAMTPDRIGTIYNEVSINENKLQKSYPTPSKPMYGDCTDRVIDTEVIEQANASRRQKSAHAADYD